MEELVSTRIRILEVTRTQLMERGLSRLTVKGVADELGLTKQAVLYWFPTKTLLLQEIFIEALELEAEVLRAAVVEAEDARDAVRCFLEKGLAYHKANLPRFRLSYLVTQVDGKITALVDEESSQRIYAATTRLYDALEEAFAAAPGFPAGVNPRNFGVSLHMALLGHACIFGSMEALGDSFKQTFEEMVEALTAVLVRGIEERP